MVKTNASGRARASRAREIGTRVSQLIDVFHGGNVNSAAKHVGLSQPALRALAEGKRTSPHIDSVLAIARTYAIDPDWIVTGNGKGPFDSIDKQPKMVNVADTFQEVVDRLDLSSELREGLQIVATQGGVFGGILSDLEPGPPTIEQMVGHAKFLGRAYQQASAGWATFLSGLADMYGPERVRTAILNTRDYWPRYLDPLGRDPLEVYEEIKQRRELPNTKED